MAQPIMLPEDLYTRVVEQATLQGKTPDELVRAVTEAYLQTAPTATLTYGDIPGYMIRRSIRLRHLWGNMWRR